MRFERDPLASHNERMKSHATFLNAIGVGLIGFAALRPLTESLSNATPSTLWWSLAGLAMHGLATYVLSQLRRESKP